MTEGIKELSDEELVKSLRDSQEELFRRLQRNNETAIPALDALKKTIKANDGTEREVRYVNKTYWDLEIDRPPGEDASWVADIDGTERNGIDENDISDEALAAARLIGRFLRVKATK